MTEIIAIPTRRLIPPKDDLDDVIDTSLPPLHERDIIVVTSKVIAIAQGRCLPTASPGLEKSALVAQEADAMLGAPSPKQSFYLCVKNGTLVTNAGVDESNGNGHYILWPTDPNGWARRTWERLRHRHAVHDLAVVVTDTHAQPLRAGSTGIAIGLFGLEPLESYRHRSDLFGRTAALARACVADAVAAAAGGVMGEGDECTPLAIVRGWPRVKFVDYPTHEDLYADPQSDLFTPVIRVLSRMGSVPPRRSDGERQMSGGPADSVTGRTRANGPERDGVPGREDRRFGDVPLKRS